MSNLGRANDEHAEQRWLTFIADIPERTRNPGAHRTTTRRARAKTWLLQHLKDISGRISDRTDYDHQGEDYYGS